MKKQAWIYFVLFFRDASKNEVMNYVKNKNKNFMVRVNIPLEVDYATKQNSLYISLHKLK